MRNDLDSNIEDILDHLLRRFVSGSNVVRVKDILDRSKFQLQFRWKTYVGDSEQIGDVHRFLVPDVNSTSAMRKIILADPGVGKSTLSYSLFEKIFSEQRENSLKICPIHIDLAEYANNEDFGKKEWIIDYLHNLSGDTGIRWIKRHTANEPFTSFPFFILDSLDEYLANFTLPQIQEELNKPIFRDASIITCRTQFYEYYVSSSNKTFVKNFENIILISWDDIYHRKYTNWYFSRYFDNDVPINDFVEKLKNSKDLWELCKVPIRYNMVLEILANNNMNFDLVSKLISIYHNYCIMTLKHEGSRSKTILSLNDRIYCLKIIAWKFYDDRKIGDDFAKIRFSFDTVKKILSEDKSIYSKYDNIDRVVGDIVKSSVLVEDTSDEYDYNYTNIKFSHKSIQEYFVSKYIYEILISPNSHSDLNEIYFSFISQEIDQFFKDYIAKLNGDINLLDIACTNYIRAFELNSVESEDNHDIYLRKRIAKEQISYNLGHLRSNLSYDYLIKKLESESDEFIRRSMIIGLSFGGHFENLDLYVDQLRSDPESSANQINVALQLSYFGDQPFSILEPHVDQKLPKCSNTIKKLINVISDPKNRGSWRIDLYTIIYLTKYREISKLNCEETIKENFQQLVDAISLFNYDPICKSWIETDLANELIKSLT